MAAKAADGMSRLEAQIAAEIEIHDETMQRPMAQRRPGSLEFDTDAEDYPQIDHIKLTGTGLD